MILPRLPLYIYLSSPDDDSHLVVDMAEKISIWGVQAGIPDLWND